ncbi:hypothetical protein IE077_001002 [Cardiosporidium cionae]|uniref:Uncharacterized protein n=1 Tax=Cardiosporidium cionae TaxID=476202 RepID=A0ABQ7J657_9APIC|nr:hypothetical protein IE077_001002 [Cardiosporidium cionae]|eukprot:KAF8819463.1 hypothetical protein IE077_001002 [Cardiosporidium cionae]
MSIFSSSFWALLPTKVESLKKVMVDSVTDASEAITVKCTSASQSSVVWWNSLQTVQNWTPFFNRREVYIYLMHFPPSASSNLFGYYKNMQLESRFSWGSLLGSVMIFFSFRPFTPLKGIRFLPFNYLLRFFGFCFVFSELFPTLFWPVFHYCVYGGKILLS